MQHSHVWQASNQIALMSFVPSAPIPSAPRCAEEPCKCARPDAQTDCHPSGDRGGRHARQEDKSNHRDDENPSDCLHAAWGEASSPGASRDEKVRKYSCTREGSASSRKPRNGHQHQATSAADVHSTFSVQACDMRKPAGEASISSISSLRMARIGLKDPQLQGTPSFEVVYRCLVFVHAS